MWLYYAVTLFHWVLVESKIPLNIGVLVPMTGVGWPVNDNGSGEVFLMGAKMAAEHVNNNSNILKDYELKVYWKNSRVGDL